jgi:hypothetical protein
MDSLATVLRLHVVRTRCFLDLPRVRLVFPRLFGPASVLALSSAAEFAVIA